jgi:Spy/CpxP family protein refolding chaperone
MKSRLVLLLLCCAVALPALAARQSPSPYSGQEHRDIKALSPEEIEGMLAGKGMGFAKSAELNGYPGPAHVIELANRIGLTSEQRVRTQEIFRRMESSAKALGADLVEAERELERLFRERRADSVSLQAAVERIAALQARLRFVHLNAHLEQTGVLTAEQSAAYSKLRGYHPGAQEHGSHDHVHGHR